MFKFLEDLKAEYGSGAVFFFAVPFMLSIANTLIFLIWSSL